MILSLTAEPDRFVLGGVPFWPVDHLAEPDAWAGHIPFAFWIIDALRPRRLVELGTHSGNSYLAFAQAVHRLGLGTACFAVDTWRGDAQAGYYDEEVFQELSRHHDARYGAFSRLVRSTFDDAVQHFPDASVDLLHVDGYHTYEAVTRDFETWRPKLSTRAVVLFHDINVREGDFGVWRLWGELQSRHPHFEFLHAHGLGVLGVGPDLPAAVTALFQTTRDTAESSRIREAFARLGSSVVESMHFQAIQAKGEVLQSEIARLGQEITGRDALIRKEGEERAALEEAARGRDQALQSEIARLGQEITGRDALIRKEGEERAALEEAARGRDQALQSEIARLGQEITGRDALIRKEGEERAALEEAARGRDQALQSEIARLGQEITGRDALIRKEGEERAALEEAARGRDQALQSEIARLGQEITARDALIRKEGEERAVLEEAARGRDQALQSEIARLGQEITGRDALIRKEGEERAALEEAARGRDQALQSEIARLGQEITTRDALIRKEGEERAALEEAARGREQALQSEIARLGQEITGRDALIRREGEERAVLEEAARGREQALQSEIARLGQEITGRARGRDQAFQSEIARLGQEITARDALIRREGEERAALEEAARGRDQALQSEITRLGQEITARDALIRKEGEERAALEEAAGGRDQARVAEIEEQRRLIDGLQHEIVRLGTLRETDRQELVAQRQHLNRVERERSEASGETEALRAALTALHQSRSLRITRPLRQGADWYRTSSLGSPRRAAIVIRPRRGPGECAKPDRGIRPRSPGNSQRGRARLAAEEAPVGPGVNVVVVGDVLQVIVHPIFAFTLERSRRSASTVTRSKRTVSEESEDRDLEDHVGDLVEPSPGAGQHRRLCSLHADLQQVRPGESALGHDVVERDHGTSRDVPLTPESSCSEECDQAVRPAPHRPSRPIARYGTSAYLANLFPGRALVSGPPPEDRPAEASARKRSPGSSPA